MPMLNIRGTVREFSPNAGNPPIPGASVQVYDVNRAPMGQPAQTGPDGSYAMNVDIPARNNKLIFLVLVREGGFRDSSRRRETSLSEVRVNFDLIRQ